MHLRKLCCIKPQANPSQNETKSQDDLRRHNLCDIKVVANACYHFDGSEERRIITNFYWTLILKLLSEAQNGFWFFHKKIDLAYKDPNVMVEPQQREYVCLKSLVSNLVGYGGKHQFFGLCQSNKFWHCVWYNDQPISD